MLQSLDTLGAGFQLASHDLDIRGAGNLLGEEQSGHIKEVGFELYQQMLEEAVTSLKAGITEPVADQWSPQITIGTPVLIPEDYVADLSVRLGALSPARRRSRTSRRSRPSAPNWSTASVRCRRRSSICCRSWRSRRCAAGPMSSASIPAPKGAVLAFRDNTFANPEGLMRYIARQAPIAKVRPDMKVVFLDDWEKPEQRLKGTTTILRNLVKIAEDKKAA